MTRRPNKQLRNIVLEETNDGRDVVRYLKSVFMEIEDAPRLFGLIHDDYARVHRIAAARILARLGLEEGKRYLRRNYVQTPFKRVHPEDEDLPRREMAASTSELYRLVKKETNDGRDIIIRFVGIMKGHYPGYKPHLRLAAAKELVRQIEFDYDDELPPSGSVAAAAEPDREFAGSAAIPVNSELPVNPDSDDTSESLPDQPLPVHPENPTSDDFTGDETPAQAHPAYPAEPDSDGPSNPYRAYADIHCAEEAESIYQSIIRRASGRPTLDSAKREAAQLIADFNLFSAGCDPEFTPITVPEELLSKSLAQRIEDSDSYIFDPGEFYDYDRDDFYYCMCRGCEDCDELEFYIEFISELEEETDDIFEDP